MEVCFLKVAATEENQGLLVRFWPSSKLVPSSKASPFLAPDDQKLLDSRMPSLSDALTTLRQHFGFEDFREGQREVVGSILEGKDAVVVMPTGSGKSLCYQLPAMILEGVTLVVSPLIALMKDQVDGLQARGLPRYFYQQLDRRT